MVLLPAVIQGWQAGTQQHFPAPFYRDFPTHKCSPELPCSSLCLLRLWCESCRVSPSTSQVWPRRATVNGFPCLQLLCGKKTHIVITTASLVVALCEGMPTCDWDCETGGGMCEISVWRLGSSSEIQREWASCTSNITYGPAGLEGLANTIHMCYILSEPLPGFLWRWVEAWREGPYVCVSPLCACVRTAGEHFCHLMIFQTWVFTVLAGSHIVSVHLLQSQLWKNFVAVVWRQKHKFVYLSSVIVGCRETVGTHALITGLTLRPRVLV